METESSICDNIVCDEKWRAEAEIGGNERALQALRDLIISPFRHSLEAQTLGLKRRSGLLLYGPPETGKSGLVRAVVQECDAHLIVLSPHSLHRAHAGESEKALREAFAEASSHAVLDKPSVIFIDEIDVLCPRPDSRGEKDVRIASQLFTLMDSNKPSSSAPRFVVVAATNSYTEEEAEAGLICKVHVSAKKKFKLLYFDREEDGGLRLALSRDPETGFFKRLDAFQPFEITELKPGSHVLAVYGDVPKGEILADLIIRLGLRIEEETIANLIAVYGRQHKLKEAKRLYLAAGESKYPGKSVISSMIDAYVRCSWLEDAYELFMEATGKGCDPGAVTISILVNALTNRGKHREAEHISWTCLEKNMVLATVGYNTLVKAMLEAGKLQCASDIYEQMHNSGVPCSIQTYNTMISVYGRGLQLDKAIEIFSDACRSGLYLDEKIYTNMIMHYGKADHLRLKEGTSIYRYYQLQRSLRGTLTDHLMRFINKDPEGYVPIHVVSSLKKVKAVIYIDSRLSAMLQNSAKLVVSEDGKKVRRIDLFSESSLLHDIDSYVSFFNHL